VPYASNMPMDFDHLVLQETPDAIVVTTPDGSVVHWNKCAEVVFGYRSEEALSCLLSAMLIPADRMEEDRLCRESLVQKRTCRRAIQLQAVTDDTDTDLHQQIRN
jgi:PAS domain S-box-containing protein